jgi:hypothetical protein
MTVYRAATIVAGLMLVGALFALPYGYYQLLRLVVCAVAAYGAWLAAQGESVGWTVGLGLLALLFNPVVPVYLDRGTWAVIDVVSAGVIVASGFRVEAEAKGSQRS